LSQARESVLGTVWFLAYTDRQKAVCTRILEGMRELGRRVEGRT